MNVLLLTAHSIAEYDDLRMLTDLGYNTFSIGAYSNPLLPGDDKRPPIYGAPYFQAFAEATADQMAAKEHLPDLVLDWADTIIVHHYPERWIAGQWNRIKGKRVIWRTCGQSNPWLEQYMRQFTVDGLQVVRYSPKEKETFESIGQFAGQDAVIRFGKYRSDFPAWDGSGKWGTNVTQNMLQRGRFCGAAWYADATMGIPMKPAGPGSEELPGGVGPLDMADMYRHLAKAAVYLYTGTLPASYTLGFIEALMVGVPVVSIGPSAFGVPLLETHEMSSFWYDDPAAARRCMQLMVESPEVAIEQWTAASLFDIERVGPQWKEFLG